MKRKQFLVKAIIGYITIQNGYNANFLTSVKTATHSVNFADKTSPKNKLIGVSESYISESPTVPQENEWAW